MLGKPVTHVGLVRGTAQQGQPRQVDAALGPWDLASRQHAIHPFVGFLVGLEPVNTLGCPPMFKRAVQFDCQGLQLHPAGKGLRRLGPSSDKPINLFLNVDERLFHGKARLRHRLGGCKRRATLPTFANHRRDPGISVSSRTDRCQTRLPAPRSPPRRAAASARAPAPDPGRFP